MDQPAKVESQASAGAVMVLLLAGLMSLNALAIDIMLPALPAMAAELGLTDPAHEQWVILVFAAGMGVGQLFFGPLSDRYGRKPVLLISLLVYAGFAAACNLSPSFEALIAFRLLQGIASAGGRVIAVAVVRDQFHGDVMASTMSMVMTVFMVVPILAPTLGQFILGFGDWRAIFWFLCLFSLFMTFACSVRLPETLPPERRRPLSVRALGAAYFEVLRSPITLWYTLALGFVFGRLLGYVSSAEQIFRGFGKEDSFVYYFAGVAAGMSVGNFVNARIVRAFGTRRVAHIALLFFVGVQAIYVAFVLFGEPGFPGFYAATLLGFMFLGMIGANFNAIALEPMGHLAGTASALLGFSSTTLAALLGSTSASLGEQIEALFGHVGEGHMWGTSLGDLLLSVFALFCILVADRRRFLDLGAPGRAVAA